ncbi:MAG: PilZ domain-containing protein [Candidatus Omnitrophica bacterium]|jgi:hypothetical protein|nr:PilZ domain-containing protein [Candidatus Omnitrophota bacterium]MDD5080978.1 PilZ domain-containing protein [Candidatus Omnitrophota bacterium]MDD5441227.1 PilZ domain-containing protein [Candidatus Omnitrophota bacterium]
MQERRQHKRFEKVLPLKLAGGENDILTETKNISVSGAYCSIDKPLELMTKLNVVLLIPVKKNKTNTVKKVNCEGVIVRREYIRDNGAGLYYVGIFFSDIAPKDKKILEKYIDSAEKAQKPVFDSKHN